MPSENFQTAFVRFGKAGGLGGEAFGDFVPVDDFPETFQVVGTAVAVVNVIGVFPHVAGQ